MQKGLLSKDAPEKHIQPRTSVSVAITEDPNSPVPQEENPESVVAFRKRKYGSRWKQQKNIAVRQNLNVIHILILYVTLGIFFMILSCVCFLFANSYPTIIREDYTHCSSVNNQSNGTDDDTTPTPNNNSVPEGQECFPDNSEDDPLNASKSIICTCEVPINIDNDHLPKSGKLVLYYELSQFHQNIRRYKKDVDWDQLGGHAVVNEKAAFTNCKYSYYNSTSEKYIFPCGKMANAYFSDKFKMLDAEQNEISLVEKEIAWESDKYRFKNPKLSSLQDILSYFDLPKDWHDSLKEDFIEDEGVENEHFVVWMRPAALDKFRKKYAYIEDLKSGEYTIQVQYRYEVNSYKGTKKIVIAADSGDRPVDYFFFYAYLIVGIFCLLIGPTLYLTKCVMNNIHKHKSGSEVSIRANSPTDTHHPPDTNAQNSTRSSIHGTDHHHHHHPT